MNPRGVVSNVLKYDIVVSEFELQMWYYVHFRRKGMNPLIPSSMFQIVPFLLYQDDFGIK